MKHKLLNFPILDWKACGFLSSTILIALFLSSSCSNVLKQFIQLQSWQNDPIAKQSQYLLYEYKIKFNFSSKKIKNYNLRHIDLVQLHGLRLLDDAAELAAVWDDGDIDDWS